jgi:hypothetical protein
VRRRPLDFVPALLLLCVVAVVVLWVRNNMDRMVPLAPRVWLSRNGGEWGILDDTHQPKGLDPPPGGYGVVKDVAALEVIDGRFVVGRTRAGEWFLLSVREGGHNQAAEEAVDRFPSEGAWRAALQSRGVGTRQLKDPRKF